MWFSNTYIILFLEYVNQQTFDSLHFSDNKIPSAKHDYDICFFSQIALTFSPSTVSLLG